MSEMKYYLIMTHDKTIEIEWSLTPRTRIEIHQVAVLPTKGRVFSPSLLWMLSFARISAPMMHLIIFFLFSRVVIKCSLSFDSVAHWQEEGRGGGTNNGKFEKICVQFLCPGTGQCAAVGTANYNHSFSSFFRSLNLFSEVLFLFLVWFCISKMLY